MVLLLGLSSVWGYLLKSMSLVNYEILLFNQARHQAFTRLSSNSVRLEAKHNRARHPRRIFPLSSTCDVTFDIPPRTTGNEAAFLPLRTLRASG